MAIVKMKKLSLVCLKADRADVLSRMQQLQCVEIIEQPFEDEAGEGISPLELRDESAAAAERSAQLTSALASLKRHAPEKKGMFAQRPQLDDGAVAALVSREADVLAACEAVVKMEGEISEIRQKRSRVEAQIEQLAPLEGFDLPLEQVADTSTTQVQLGSIHPSRLEELQAAPKDALIRIEEVGRTPDAVYLLAIAHRSAAEEMAHLLSEVAFTRLTLRYEGTARQVASGFAKELAADEKRREQLAADIAAYASFRADIEAMLDLTALEQERLEAAAYLGGTREAVQLLAWVPADKADPLQKELTAVTEFIETRFDDPAEDETVPTFLENNKFMTPYESVTTMFSTPNQQDVDPSPLLMPFFVTFFGMMVSDAAYGIVLSIAGILGAYVIKLRGMMGQICKILIVGGLLTTFWGTLFGSWFGIEGIEPILFSPMNSPMEMLILCFSLGFIHIVVGMIIKAVMAFRAGDWQTAVFDQFAWIALLLGAILGAVGGVAGIPALTTGGFAVAILGVVVILLFAGRSSKGIVGRITGGLGSLYGITSYLSDILSYARLFAMGLATGVICMVFNTIAGILPNNIIGIFFGVIILIVGHTFNLAINALGAYVHSCRLQYIEYFGKFFEGGGRAFKPLMRKTRFVDFKS